MASSMPIAGVVQHYAWGRPGGLNRYLVTGGDEPQAELWFGAHPSGPASVAGGGTLADLAPDLPYLLKILAIGAPLSLQVHPSPCQARAGFARGVFVDDRSKPEAIMAIEPVTALAGLLAPADVLDRLAEIEVDGGEAGRAIRRDPYGVELARVLSAECTPTNMLPALRFVLEASPARNRFVELLGRALCICPDRILARVARAHRGDGGLVLAVLMREVHLAEGQCLYIPAGQVHCYVDGVGVEIMASSDNVVRAGLTPKTVDVTEFIRLVDPFPRPEQYLAGEIVSSDPAVANGMATVESSSVNSQVRRFCPPVDAFELYDVRVATGGSVALRVAGPAIVLCLEGNPTLRLGTGNARGEALRPGGALFLAEQDNSIALAVAEADTRFVVATPGQGRRDAPGAPAVSAN